MFDAGWSRANQSDTRAHRAAVASIRVGLWVAVLGQVGHPVRVHDAESLEDSSRHAEVHPASGDEALHERRVAPSSQGADADAARWRVCADAAAACGSLLEC